MFNYLHFGLKSYLPWHCLKEPSMIEKKACSVAEQLVLHVVDWKCMGSKGLHTFCAVLLLLAQFYGGKILLCYSIEK